MMNILDFDMKELQDIVIGNDNLFVQNTNLDSNRERRLAAVKRIVNLYQTSRKEKKVIDSTYKALSDTNPFVRVAAVDLISEMGNNNSLQFLFKALEDEENEVIKRKIAKSITKLEAKINNDLYSDEDDVSLVNTVKILTYLA